MLNSVKKYIMKNISPHGSSALSPPNTSSQINYSVLWISLQIVHSFTDRFFLFVVFSTNGSIFVQHFGFFL